MSFAECKDANASSIFRGLYNRCIKNINIFTNQFFLNLDKIRITSHILYLKKIDS